MNVYAAVYDDPEIGYTIEAIFSNLDAAKHYARTKGYSLRTEIQEFTLDEQSPDNLCWFVTFNPEGEGTNNKKWNITPHYLDSDPDTSIQTRPGLDGATTFTTWVKHPKRDTAYVDGFRKIIGYLQETNPMKWIGYPFSN